MNTTTTTTTTAPAEPPVGTLVRDRHGAIHRRCADGWGDQYGNTWHLGVWAAMWEGRGPLVEVTEAQLAGERAAEAEQDRRAAAYATEQALGKWRNDPAAANLHALKAALDALAPHLTDTEG